MNEHAAEIGQLPTYRELPEAAGGTHSAWHVFGEDDQVGLINLQSDESVLAAAGSIVTGQRFALSAELNAIQPPMFGRRLSRHSVIDEGTDCDFDDVYDDYNPQASSQWDSLAHVGFRPNEFYNGATADDVRSGRRNTIEHWARRGIVGRAVLLDVAGLYLAEESDYCPGASRAVTVEDLERARVAAGVNWEPGDVLLLHTGFLAWYMKQDLVVRARYAATDVSDLTGVGLGRGTPMLEYLWDSRLAAVAADNPGVELMPFDVREEAWPHGFLHYSLIGQLGMALGELWWLHDLAMACRADGRYTSFLVSAPLNTPGGISSPPNAIAIR